MAGDTSCRGQGCDICFQPDAVQMQSNKCTAAALKLSGHSPPEAAGHSPQCSQCLPKVPEGEGEHVPCQTHCAPKKPNSSRNGHLHLPSAVLFF